MSKNNCCSEVTEKDTSLRLFAVGNELWLSVNGKTATTNLQDLVRNTISENTYYITVTTNGQVLFNNAFPSDETFLSLIIGIQHQLDVDYNIINQNILWINPIELEVGDVLIVKTIKINE